MTVIVGFCLGVACILAGIDGVKPSDSWLQTPVSAKVREGDDHIFRCQPNMTSRVPAKTKWFKDRIQIATNNTVHGDKEKYKIIGNHSEGEFHLFMRHVSLLDEAEYTCEFIHANPRKQKGRLTVDVPYRNVSLSEMGKGVIVCLATRGKPPTNKMYWYADSILHSEVDPNISENSDGTFNSVSRLSLASFSKPPRQLMCSVIQPDTQEVYSQPISVASGAGKGQSRLVTVLLWVASSGFYLHYL
ncbi:kin of IRRE-like protein 2 isoform X2 [Ptychodera flava]|uniref:kin of IRRE-like protein 2 isoform X2 n=1 Tax=Ptychodera flava TaxID=63121 RepID=UPI00396A4164